MKINGIDISEQFGARVAQWRFSPETRSLKHESEWVRGSPLPIFQTPSATFKDFTVTLMVYGDGRDDIMLKISDILAALLDTAELELDGWTHKFCGVLEKSGVKELSETSRKRFMELSLQFSGYEHGDEVSIEASGSTISITNPGNMVSPAIIELTPTVGQSEITISGLCRDSATGEALAVTVSNLTTGNTVLLDGISGLVTENGELKAGDVDMWALPTLLPGLNTVTISTEYMETIIKVLPIFA
ncbi:MAG: hypothetical protein LUI07_07900 [Lachnospiraceae bacterium]|nr:hypothetical protein [Lachnospiraceae bacterium]